METPTAVGVQRATAHRAALSESEWRMENERYGFICCGRPVVAPTVMRVHTANKGRALRVLVNHMHR